MGGYGSYMELYLEAMLEQMLRDPATMAAVNSVLVLILGIFAGLAIFGLICYILESWAVHKLARDRQIRHGWLAWLPVGFEWVLGSIADQYHYVAKGRVHGRRKVLLGLAVAILAVFLVQIGCYACYFAWLYDLVALEYSFVLQLYSVAQVLQLAIAVLVLILTIHRYIALHDLYASCEPDGATAYLVISILLPVTEPFFVFSCRKKEYGMPPRKPVMSVPTTWQPPEIPTLDEE